MHEELQVPNYRTGDRGIELAPGVCIAIEPMLTLGSADVETLGDGWTVVTRDRSLAAHFEHTIAVTGNGAGDPDDGMKRIDEAGGAICAAGQLGAGGERPARGCRERQSLITC